MAYACPLPDFLCLEIFPNFTSIKAFKKIYFSMYQNVKSLIHSADVVLCEYVNIRILEVFLNSDCCHMSK